MRVIFHKRFKKGLERLSPALKDKVIETVRRFVADPFHPSLGNHSLKGQLANWRSFYVTRSIRVIFEERDSYAIMLMLDVGTHDRVYR